MKKALQVAHFRADLSLPERAVGSGSREARSRSFFHCFAKFFRADRGDPFAGLLRLLRGGLRSRLPSVLRGRRRGLRKGAGRELDPRRSVLSETRPDLALEVPQLERPCGGARVDEQRAVPAQPR